MRVIPNLNSAFRRSQRFTVLWAGLFGLIVLITAAEGIVFWRMGFRYQPSSLPVAAWSNEISIARKSNLAALSVSIMGRLGNENWSDVVVIDPLRRDPVWLGVTHLNPHHVAIAPDANSVAIASEDGTIYSMTTPFNNSATSEKRRERLFVHSGDGDFFQMVFAPDGQSIAATGERFVSVWDWPTGLLLHQHQYKQTGIEARSIAFAPDSRTMASLDGNGCLRLYDARSGELIQEKAVSEPPYSAAAVAFDAQLVAVAEGHLISVCGFEGDDTLWSSPCDSPIIAMSPSDGSLASVAFEHGGYRIMIRELETGLARCRIDTGPPLIKGLEFASDNLLYSTDSRGNVRAWDVDSQREQWVVPLLDSAPINEGIARSE